jgi:hypothetical protein
MTSERASLLDDLSRCHDPRQAEETVWQQHAAWLTKAEDEQMDALLSELPAEATASPSQGVFLGALAQCLAQRHRQRAEAGLSPRLSSAAIERIGRLYRAWSNVPGRYALLAWLAASLQGDALRMLAELLASDPPRDAALVAQVLSPLVQRSNYDPAVLFPRLLDGLQHASSSAAILDLCNFFTRRGWLGRHPAAARWAQLNRLLSQLVQQLERLDAIPAEPAGAGEAGPRARRQQQVFESLALVVSLCDALALLGDPQAIPALHEALQLRHRRVRAEAAAALAALGDAAGEAALIELAAEPVTRLRVLAYAEELGLEDRIEPRYQSAAARAEAELALWLAQPAQFGLPPEGIELFDERTLYWPGHEEPIECFLFRFTYRLADGEYHNVGLAGPCTHAFRADLTDLPPDDIYAAFAGWYAEHEDIYHQDANLLLPTQQAEVARLERRLRDEGHQEIRPRLLGYFLGDRLLVADTRYQGREGTAVADADRVDWRPRGAVARPLDAEMEYNIYKGRRMLRSFNP